MDRLIGQDGDHQHHDAREDFVFVYDCRRHFYLYLTLMRFREKNCFKCSEVKEVLYRCRFSNLKDWVFLCGSCLTSVKETHSKDYQYGGTWKAKKS